MAEANRRKWKVLGEIQLIFDKARAGVFVGDRDFDAETLQFRKD
jgi:hypothetical protein